MSVYRVQYFYPHRYNLGLVCRDKYTEKTKPFKKKKPFISTFFSQTTKALSWFQEVDIWFSIAFLEGNTSKP